MLISNCFINDINEELDEYNKNSCVGYFLIDNNKRKRHFFYRKSCYIWFFDILNL